MQHPPPQQIIVVEGKEPVKGEHLKCCLCFPVRFGFMFMAVLNTISLVLLALMIGVLFALFGSL